MPRLRARITITGAEGGSVPACGRVNGSGAPCTRPRAHEGRCYAATGAHARGPLAEVRRGPFTMPELATEVRNIRRTLNEWSWLEILKLTSDDRAMIGNISDRLLVVEQECKRRSHVP